jgi:hypothetical protein
VLDGPEGIVIAVGAGEDDDAKLHNFLDLTMGLCLGLPPTL